MDGSSTKLYFALALSITTLALLPAVLAVAGVLSGSADDYMAGAPIAIFGPTIAACVASAREGGRAAVRKLLSGLGAGRVGPLWFFVALGLPTLAYLVARALYELLPGDDGGPWFWPPGDAQHVVGAVLVPIGEEIGWRGYALPRLIARFGPLRASLLLGGLWGVWHLPMFIAVGTTDPAYYALMVPYFLAGSVMFTWLYQRTNGSLLLAVLLHVGAHLSNPGQSPELTPTAISTFAYVALALGLVAFDRPAFRRAPESSA
ncbi:MAG: CPBP family intramembrane metalloprotease [Sandaracinaceae bacterium]|nr:CPBP family intramembrane metalloprotease [Sandaracinaceae bacterium]